MRAIQKQHIVDCTFAERNHCFLLKYMSSYYQPLRTGVDLGLRSWAMNILNAIAAPLLGASAVALLALSFYMKSQKKWGTAKLVACWATVSVLVVGAVLTINLPSAAQDKTNSTGTSPIKVTVTSWYGGMR